MSEHSTNHLPKIALAGAALLALLIYNDPPSLDQTGPDTSGRSASPSSSSSRTPEEPDDPTPSGQPEKNAASYFTFYHKAAEKTEKATGVPKELVLAMSAHESTYGSSELAVKAHNFFGIKAHSDWDGPVYNKPTHEQLSKAQLPDPDKIIKKKKIGPNLYDIKIVAPFRKYDDAAESFENYGDYLKNRGFYDDAFDEDDPKKFLGKLVDNNGPKYATDRQYAVSVGKKIDAFEKLYENS